MRRRTEGKSLSGFRLPSLSLPDISTATSDNSLRGSIAAGIPPLAAKPIMPESLEVDTARRKPSVSDDWSSEQFLSPGHRVGSWNTSLDSVTVRPVSPKIFSLCSKFMSSSDNNELSSASKDHLAIHNSRPRSKSFTLASISDDPKSPEQLSSLFIRRSSSPKPLKINLAPPEIYSIDPENGGLFPKQLLSPSTSPSSGYGSGFNSSSPVCMSPRSHSPTLESQLEREPIEEKSSLSVVPHEQGHTRTRRSISHDSGVSRLSVESPSCVGRSSSEEEPCPESRSQVRSMHSHCGGNITIQVPKPVRPQLVKTKPVFHLYPPGSPTNVTMKPEILSPDEGFQDLRLPHEQPSSSTPTSQPLAPLSPAHVEIKRTELRVRLNPPGSPLPTRIHETIPGLSRRFSEEGSLDQDGDEKLLSSATSTEEQRVPFSSTESKPLKRDAMPPALVIDMCETPPRSEQNSPPGSFNANSGPNSIRPYQFLTLADIQSGTVHRKLSTDSTLSSFSQGSIEDELDEHRNSRLADSAPAPTSAKAPFTAAGKRAQFSSVSNHTHHKISLPVIIFSR